MATLPSDEKLKEINEANQIEIEAKVLDQAALGKGFNIAADGHGPGVVPEEFWKQSKVTIEEQKI